MTNEDADEMLASNEWAKVSDARELLLQAAHIGAMSERERCARLCDKHARSGWNDDRKAQAKLLASEIRGGPPR